MAVQQQQRPQQAQQRPQQYQQRAQVQQPPQTRQMQQVRAMSDDEYLKKTEACLVKQLDEHADALPKGTNRQRFILNSIAIVRDNVRQYSGKVEPESLVVTLAKGAYLGLDFFNRECYAIPYNGVAQFQTDYKGEIKLCKKYSSNPIKDIYAKLVREGDFFEEVIENGFQSVNFRPVPFSDAKVIGAFAVVLYQDGSMLYDTMSAAEIEKTRSTYSKAKNSQAWSNSPGEMYKKTVLRRLCKLIDLDFDRPEQRAAFDEGGDAEFVETPSKAIRKGVEDTVQADVFAESTVVEEPEVQPEPEPEYNWYDAPPADNDRPPFA